MPSDKFTAIWVSHTSISDFLQCPRAYYLKNVYRDPSTGHKVKLMSPPLALGQCVHEVIESLSIVPTDKRFSEPLMNRYEIAWKKVTGKKGGFIDQDTELQYKQRGMLMLQRVMDNPGPLVRLAVKIKMNLPYFWLSEDDNIVLCGKVDWLEYLPETDSVHIIDFKTGKREENPDSLQLPIYCLLVHHCQKRRTSKASYWYIERSDELEEKELPNLDDAREKVLRIAKQIKLARQLERFKCPHDGCYCCKPVESILNGEAEFVGNDEYNADVYILLNKVEDEFPDSEIL